MGAQVTDVSGAFALAREDSKGPAEFNDAKELRGEELRLKLEKFLLWRRVRVHQHQSLGLVDEFLLQTCDVLCSCLKVFLLGLSIESRWKFKFLSDLLNLEGLKCARHNRMSRPYNIACINISLRQYPQHDSFLFQTKSINIFYKLERQYLISVSITDS